MSIVLQSSGGGLITINEPTTASNFTQTLPAGTGTTVVNGVNGVIVHGTSIASTSGTSIDFTGIPSWAKRITIMFNGVSTNGSSFPFLQLGDSGGIETTGYASTGTELSSTATSSLSSTAGFGLQIGWLSSLSFTGAVTLTLQESNLWVMTGTLYRVGVANLTVIVGNKSLSATLDRIRITTVNGTDTFDAGSINILYE